MSHSVTITRTTTTSNTTAILLNTGYFATVGGLLKLAETILGAVCVGLSAYYLRSYYYQNQVPVLFFLLMATAFLITTFCLMFSSLISISTASFLPKTIFEVIYHIVAFSLYLAASINLMVDISKYSKNSTYDAFLAASIIGLINSVLYLCSAVLAIRSYRGLSI